MRQNHDYCKNYGARVSKTVAIHTGRVVTMNTKYPTFLFFKNYLCLFKGVKILTQSPKYKARKQRNRKPFSVFGRIVATLSATVVIFTKVKA